MRSASAAVAVTIFTQAAQAGALIYSFGTLAPSIEAEFSAPRASVMLATTCLSIVTSLMAPLAGRWVDAHSLKRLMWIGALCLGVGLLLLSQVTALWQVWLVYALILPFANLLLGQMTSSALVTRWYDLHRGRALGVSALGTSVGGFAFPIVLVAAIERFGWRGGAAVIGVATAVGLGVIIGLGVKDPGTKSGGQAAGEQPMLTERSFGDIVKLPTFWMITLPIGIKLAAYLGLLSNLIPYALGLGIDRLSAASLLSVLAIASMVGKLGFGVIADRVPLKLVLLAALAMIGLGFAALLVVRSYGGLAAVCATLGLAAGGLLPVWGAIVAQYFGRSAFGRVMGLMNLTMMPLTAASAPLAGYVFDRTGSYDGAFIGYLLAIMVAMLLLLPLAKAPAAAPLAR